MIFYLLYENERVGYVYFNDTFFAKEEKAYLLDFDSLEHELGEIQKIQATPVLVENRTATACANKKLPIIVSSGCH